MADEAPSPFDSLEQERIVPRFRKVTPPRGGPWVILACFTDAVQQEKDGTLRLGRIIDKINIEVKATAPGGEEVTMSLEQLLPSLPPLPVTLILVVGIKGGDFAGDAVLAIEIDRPDGKRVSGLRRSMTLPGAHGGMNAILRMTLSFEGPGVRWFNVRLGRKLLTRVPMEVSYTLTKAVESES